MSSASRNRPSEQVDLPADVTDPLLWRLGFDVARAHQPDDSGRCGNLACPDEPGPCPALRNAEQAMRLARRDDADQWSGPVDPVVRAEPAPADGLPRRPTGPGLRAA